MSHEVSIRVLATCLDCHSHFGRMGELFDSIEEADTWAAAHTREESWIEQPWGHDDYVRLWVRTSDVVGS